ncbi:MAG: hypothetical protein HUU38_07990 [Anaerolineales bacterium]|nr:hypothetical protein [Anaerolineales bacterium]
MAFLLESLDLSHKEFAEKISSHDAHKDHITSSLVSHWLSGKRDPTPYITQISQVLRPALKYQLHFSNGDLLQEISDWYGLLALPNLEKALRAQFPAWQEPLRVGNFPRLQLPAYHVARPELTSALIYKLLAPDPENGLFHRNGLALTGWPGVGKSILAFELMKKAHPFFSGGVLFGNLKRASSHQILLQWAHELNLSKPEEQSPTNLALAINMKLIKTGGRWLCILDAVSDFGELNEILLPHPWILITTHGTQPLLPHGLEDWASPLPPFTQEESIAVFQKRLGTQWEKYNDPQKVKKLHRLVEGLPLAFSILAGLVHSRGWEYTLTRFQDEMRIISTVKLSPGTQPEISLQLTIDLALAAVPSELHHLLKAMSVFAPGMAIPSFLVEMFLKKFREIEEKPGAWLAKLETLRESGLIESFEVEDDPGLRYWRIHRIVALYISGQILPEMVSLLHRQMKVLLSQHALAA